MKYIKTYEENKEDTPLKKLYNFLKNKGLDVLYQENDIRIFPPPIENINGDDYIIYFGRNKYKGNKYEVHYMFDIEIINNQRAGKWESKYFQIDEFEEIYEFAKEIKELNDTQLAAKKYNL